MEPRICFTTEGNVTCTYLLCTYQRQHKIEKGSPTVEEDGQESSDSGEKQAHVPAHNNP